MVPPKKETTWFTLPPTIMEVKTGWNTGPWKIGLVSNDYGRKGMMKIATHRVFFVFEVKGVFFCGPPLSKNKKKTLHLDNQKWQGTKHFS